jgi:hypothetical protein
MSASKPATREELKGYCLRRLGAPILEINVANEQIEDLIDMSLQYFNERHFDGVEKMFLKHKFTEADIARFQTSNTDTVALNGDVWEERNNYLEVPDHVIGIERIFSFVASSIRGDLFGIEYQMFLNDLYAFGSLDILNYYMTKSYLETLDMVLNTGAMMQLRYTKRQNRLYIDHDPKFLNADRWFVIECYRALNPSDHSKIYNDSFLKRYVTAQIKMQWGQNLIKFNNIQLPGGASFNGEKLYEEGKIEIQDIEARMQSEYELPPNFLIG